MVILTRAKDSSAALEHSPANFSLESPVASVFGHFMTSLVVDSPARPPASSPASQPPTISKSADERINLPKLLQMKGWQLTDLNSELANEAAAKEVIQMPSTKSLLNFVAAKVKTEASVKAMHDKEVHTKDAQFNALQASTIKLKHQPDAQVRLLNGAAQNKSNASEEKQRKVRSTVLAYANDMRCLTCTCTCTCICACKVLLR